MEWIAWLDRCSRSSYSTFVACCAKMRRISPTTLSAEVDRQSELMWGPGWRRGNTRRIGLDGVVGRRRPGSVGIVGHACCDEVMASGDRCRYLRPRLCPPARVGRCRSRLRPSRDLPGVHCQDIIWRREGKRLPLRQRPLVAIQALSRQSNCNVVQHPFLSSCHFG